jgi:hypothetical protein
MPTPGHPHAAAARECPRLFAKGKGDRVRVRVRVRVRARAMSW